MPSSEAMARDTTLSAAAAHGRRRAEAGDPDPGRKVWTVRLRAHHGVVAECGVAGGEGSSAADLATRRAEGAAETAATRAAVVSRWFVRTVASGAGESRVELRFRESDDARRTSAAHPRGDRRVYAGVFGVAGGAAFGEFAGDRNVGGCDVGARDPGTHSFGQWAGVHCRRVAEVAGSVGYEDAVYRTWESVGERVLRELQREVARRVLEWRDLLLAEGGTDSDGEMARGIQHGATALGARLQAAGAASHHSRTGAWRCGKQNPFPTSPHPRRRLRTKVKRGVTLTFHLVQNIGQVTGGSSRTTLPSENVAPS